jgi:hypothetical protein
MIDPDALLAGFDFECRNFLGFRLGPPNRLHWVLDVTFGEDASLIREGHAPQNVSPEENSTQHASPGHYRQAQDPLAPEAKDRCLG